MAVDFYDTLKAIHPLMNEAYARWQDGGDLQHADSFRDFVLGLGQKHADAVMIGKLNEQVENGGFSQWRFNGYHKPHSCLMGALNRVGGPAAMQVKQIVLQYLTREMRSDPASKAYYAIHEHFLREADEALAKRK